MEIGGKIFKLKIWGWIIPVLLTVLALFAFYKTRQVLIVAKAQLESGFNSHNPEYQLKIADISTNYWNAIHLSGIHISELKTELPEDILTIEKVKIKISLAALAKNYASKKESVIFRSLRSFTVENPRLRLVKKENQWRFPHFKAGGGSLPLIPIYLSGGSLNILDPQSVWSPFLLEQFEGNLNLSLEDPKIEISASGPEGTRFYAKSELENRSTLVTELKCESIPLEKYLKNIVGTIRPSEWSLTVQAKNSWPLPKNLLLNPKIILESKNSRAAGVGTFDFTSLSPTVNAKISGELDFEEFLPILSAAPTPKGKLLLEMALTEEIFNPKITGTIKTEAATLANEPLHLKSSVAIRTNEIIVDSLNGTAGKSFFRGRGSFSKNRSDYHFSLVNYPLSNFTPKWIRLGGFATLSLNGIKRENVNQISSAISIKDASFNDRKLGDLKGRMDYNPRAFKLNLDDGTRRNEMSFNLIQGDSVIKVERSRIRLAQGENCELEASVDKKTKNIEGTLKIASLDPKLLGASVPWLSNLEGKFSVEGKISGVSSNPVLSGEVSSTPLFLKEEGKSATPIGEYKSDITLSKDFCEMKTLTLGSDTVGSFKLNLKDKKDLELKIKQKEGNLSIAALTERANDPTPFKFVAQFQNFNVKDSHINGTLNLNGNCSLADSFRLHGNFSCENFSVNQFAAGTISGALDYEKGKLNIKSFSWGKILGGKLKVERTPEKKFSLTGHLSSSEKTIVEWCRLLSLKEPPLAGAISMQADVNGHLLNPLFSIEGKCANVTVKLKQGSTKEPLSGNFSATYDRGFLKSLALRLSSLTGTHVISHGEANLKTGSIDLENSFQKLDVDFLQDLFGWSGFSGKSAGFLKVQGDWNSPIAKGKIAGGAGFLGNIPLDYWELSGTIKQRELLITGSKLIGRRGSWRFTVMEDSWIKVRPGFGIDYKLATDFANIPLGEIFLVGSGTAVGSWGKNLATNSLSLTAEIKTNELFVNELEIQPAQFALEYRNKVLVFSPSTKPSGEFPDAPAQIRGEINFKNTPCLEFKNLELSKFDKRILWVNGEFCNEKPNFEIQGSGLDANALTGLLKSPIPLYGETEMRLLCQTKNRVPEISGNFHTTKGSVGPVPMDSLESQIKWTRGLLTLSQFQAKKKDLFTLDIAGTIPLKLFGKESPSKKIELLFKVPQGDLSFMNYLESKMVHKAKGAFHGELILLGDTDHSKMEGELTISNGEFDSQYFIQKADNMDVKLKLQSNRLTFERANLNVGKGRLELTGSVDTLFSEGEVIFDRFDLNLKTLGKKGIAFQVPELPLNREKLGLIPAPSRGYPTLDLHLTGDTEQPQMKGWIQLEETLFSYPPTKKTQREHPWLKELEWDLALKAGEQTMFQNEYAYVKINGGIHIQGRDRNFVVSGKINSNEGNISIYGAKFDLRSAELEIVQPPKITAEKGALGIAPTKNVAYLTINAEQTTLVPTPDGKEKQEDTITLTLERTPLSENFDSKMLKFRSSRFPNLVSEKVAINAGIGFDLDQLSPQDRDVQLRQGIARLLDSQLAGPLAKSLMQRTGLIDRLEISQDEQTISREDSLRGNIPTAFDPFLGTNILLEKTFGGKLGLGYRATLDKIKDRADFIHQLELRYPFYKGIWLYGTTELDSQENLGRERKTEGGIKTRIRFDPADLFKKKPKGN